IGPCYNRRASRECDLTMDTATKMTHSLAPALRGIGNKYRLQILNLLVSWGNGRFYALDRQKAAMLNASFISLMGRVGSSEPSNTTRRSAAATEENLPLAVPQTPEACKSCQNASFVREVLDELDQSIDKAQQYQARLRQMSSQVLTAQEEERKRIAREMHDDTAQALTSVLVRL